MTSPPAARGRPSSAPAILDTARTLLDEGTPVSFDSVAHASGLTKPGLMYHFPTKSALMEALVDHVVASQERELARFLDVPLESASPRQRLGAYVRWALQSRHRRSDLVMLSDPKLGDRMLARWTERFAQWVQVPADLPPDEQARLHAARLLADGAWLADSSSTFPLADDERPRVLSVALELLGEGPR
ncbi:TetR/AcrR family transcriptional regulator [Mycolicibacterium austroafricanum]|uniref:TetR/AcrR family transcriptional regulator n=1 Tax=Mycolicibacterium austroafricanum TaxID=39687 RepID=UPI001CA32FD7|nr:TetR family transcriptional regulator [Mycolicibacterium austroafricanum]QZT65133.1 TetR family transcriptional regulator [Mycolicibacterium austroafricanum]